MKNFDFDNDTSKNIFYTLIFTIWQVKDYKRRDNFIQRTTFTTLVGITIDSELNFENHLSAIRNKVSRKINALGRIANYIPLGKRRIVMKTFIESQFNYCPLTWMFHSRTINNKTNR